MREAGAEVELVHLHGMDIGPCLGCLSCWLKTPGRCVQQDDAAGVLDRLARSDITVCATPLYFDGMNAAMKGLLDRSVSLLQPFFVLHDGHCRHDPLPGYRPGRVVLVSVSGFTELDNFDPLLVHIRAMCRNMRSEFAGALLRPYANSLPGLAESGVDVEDVYAACREAGRQLVQEGGMDQAVLARVSRELVPRERYIKAVNVHFRRELGRNRVRLPGEGEA